MRITRYLSLVVMAAAAAWGQVNIQPRQITAPLTGPAAPPSQQVAPSSKPEAPAGKHAASRPAAKAATKPAGHTSASTPAAASKPAASAKAPAPAKMAAPAKAPAPAKTAAKPKPASPAKTAQTKSPMKPKMAARPAPPVRPVVQKAAAPAPKPAAAPEQAAARPRARRDPFVSPIVEARPESGPTCETGKKCLAVNQITLRGIVKSQEGMIAVVENRRRVTYFLRENDPVFNGYVVKITGDAVIFRENTLDSMGRVGTRDVTLKVNAPAV